jgi:hypothetical protein
MKNIIIVIVSIIIISGSLLSTSIILATQNWRMLSVQLFIIALVVYGDVIYFKKQKKLIAKK